MDARQGGELLVSESLVGGEIGRGHADEVVGIAEQPLGVCDGGDVGEGFFEPGDRVCVFAIHGHVYEHLEFEAEGGWVDDSPIAADDSVAFQAA